MHLQLVLPLRFLHRASSGSGEKRLMVLLHGLGSSKEDLFELGSFIPAEFEFYCLEGPAAYFGGYKWFSLEVTPAGVNYNVEEAGRSIERVEETVRELQRFHGISSSETVVGGFSQGAMLTTALSLCFPNVASKLWLMSGAAIPELVPAELPTYGVPPHALVQHGTYDQVLPISLGRDLAAILERMGVEVSFKEYPIYHSISEESLQDAQVWLQSSPPNPTL